MNLQPRKPAKGAHHFVMVMDHFIMVMAPFVVGMAEIVMVMAPFVVVMAQIVVEMAPIGMGMAPFGGLPLPISKQNRPLREVRVEVPEVGRFVPKRRPQAKRMPGGGLGQPALPHQPPWRTPV